jgi:uncharacterized membrane protein
MPIPIYLAVAYVVLTAVAVALRANYPVRVGVVALLMGWTAFLVLGVALSSQYTFLQREAACAAPTVDCHVAFAAGRQATQTAVNRVVPHLAAVLTCLGVLALVPSATRRRTDALTAAADDPLNPRPREDPPR